MRLGLIAMSGVRAWSKELNEAGLTMPGVVERSRVIASMPTLSLLTLAALTPEDIDIEYHEIRDLCAQGAPARDFDLVAIASQSAQISDAYKVADQFRAAGATVVMGGLHVSTLPDEALQHADAVVIGEAESVWPLLMRDFLRGCLMQRYRATTPYDFANSPIPRFDLLDLEKYNRLLVQTSRGCPHRCSFCASSILITPGYTTKPVERVIAEIDAVRALWRHPFIEFADDNSFCKRAQARDLCHAMKGKAVRWFTETDISIADDPELLDLMRDAGCREVLVGLESPSAEGLDRLERRANWKLRQLPRYERAVRTIQSAGIAVNGCFVLGLDSDTPATADAIYDFAARTGLFDVQITVLTPFPGTPLYADLLAQGRILEPGAWHKCTLFDVNFQPRNFSPRELEQTMLALARRLYDPAFVARRRQSFFDQARARGWPSPIESPAAA